MLKGRILAALMTLSVISMACGHAHATGNTADSINLDAAAAKNSDKGKTLPISIQRILRSAKQGSAEAQFQLGMIYEKGTGTEQNYNDAVYWYTMAANQGLPSAQFSLAKIFEQGQGGVKKDLAYAMSWYEEAARNGLSAATERIKALSSTVTGGAQSIQ